MNSFPPNQLANFEAGKFHQEFANFIKLALESDEVTDKKLSMV
jgi:hypothetical protein